MAVTTTYAEDARSLLRRRLIDSARELASEKSWRNVSMAAVAKLAGVSRQTVYNEFGSRHNLAESMMLSIVSDVLSSVTAAIESSRNDVQTALARGLESFLSFAVNEPVATSVLDEDERDDLLPLFTTEAQAPLVFATSTLSQVVLRNWPQVNPVDAREIAEMLVRLALSYVVLPVKDPAATASSVALMLGPYMRLRVGED